MKISRLLILISLFLFCCNRVTKEHFHVYDNANMLTLEQQKSIKEKLTEINRRTNNEIVICTVDSLDSKDINDYSSEIFKKIGIGKVGVNTGILIFIAYKERKMRMQVAIGNEWLISDSLSRIIIDSIKKQFLKKDYSQGLFNGIDLIDKRLSEYDWRVHDIGLKDFNKVEVDQIVCFLYKNKERKTFKYPLPTDKQFQSDFFIELNLDENGIAKLYYTKYMSNVLSCFSSHGKIKVFARVKSKNPLQLNLLGTIKM